MASKRTYPDVLIGVESTILLFSRRGDHWDETIVWIVFLSYRFLFYPQDLDFRN